ncbi:MAG: hypothetical protein F4X64_13970 [Chloroflexi bacterium]|nr:hypothetical protein [Chloroflexota bacterium]
MTVTNYQDRMQELGLVLPIDPDAASRWRAAPRLDTLHDKVGGLLGNRKANADLLLRNIGERMAKNLELGDIIAVDKFVYSRPATDDIISDLSGRCDFVVTAIAD